MSFQYHDRAYTYIFSKPPTENLYFLLEVIEKDNTAPSSLNRSWAPAPHLQGQRDDSLPDHIVGGGLLRARGRVSGLGFGVSGLGWIQRPRGLTHGM